MDLGLSGRSCIVTGATRGIGLATARLLRQEGADLVLVGRDPGGLAAVADEVGGLAVATDFTRPDAAGRVLAAALDAYGRVDVLVNNAGTMRNRDLDDLTEEDWEAQWQLNVMAPMRLMQAVAPVMAQGGFGRIVNVSSSAGKRPTIANAAYSVTKAAQLSLSRMYAERYAPDNVLVNAVTPGPVRSPLWLGPGGLADQAAAVQGVSRAEAIERHAQRLPIRRFASPEELAAVIVFLCSELASVVAGAAWSADGGAVSGIT
jgi:3-oxoacyl-[acyl-carrier protein] reductase